jgi:hypothetical protein
MATSSDDPLLLYIASVAQALSLEIAPEWLPAVRANLDVTLTFAQMVAEFPLPDEYEPAGVYRA